MKELRELRENITQLIDDVKYHSDTLTDLDRLPVIQLKVLLAKMNKLTEKTTILLHYVEMKAHDRGEAIPEEDLVPGEMKPAEQLVEKMEDHVPPENEPVDEVSLEKPEEEIHSASTETKPAPLRKEENVEDKLKRLVVKDLSNAIGINEKYLYASELFDGNIAEFMDSIKVLNAITDYRQALEYLSEIAEKHHWNKENEITVNFMELVEKKFDQS